MVERYGKHADNHDVEQLSTITEGLTGAEIEAVYLEAMFTAFERDEPPTDLDVATALNGFAPL